MTVAPALTVFISYARVDRPRVAPLAAALGARGHVVWWDDHLTGGAAFAATIEAELARADAVVVAWSLAAVTSDWVRDEAAVARDRGVLVPITLDTATPPLGFRQYHAIDFATWDGAPDAAAIDALEHAIANIAGRSSPATPVRPTRGRRGFGGVTAALLVSAVAAVLVVGGVRLSRRPAPPSAPVAGHPAAAASIAVLPFANLSGDPRDAYLSEGLAEQLRSTLASFSQIQVAARTSSSAFQHGTLDTPAIAARLGVAYVLEGSVEHSGPTVRVGAQLIEAANGYDRWSQRFDRPAGDTFRIEDDISREVANALKVRLLLPSTVHGRGGTADAAALDAYLRGRQQYDLSGDEATYRAALDRFDAAIAADPGFAAAHAARARTLIVIGNQFSDGATQRKLIDAAVVAAKQAVKLAPLLADTQSTLGFVLYNRLDFAAAAAAYDRAYQTSRGDADQLVRYAGFKYRMGDTAAASAALDRAAALDPLNPRVPKAQALTAMVAHRFPDAITSARAALAINPAMSGVAAIIGDATLLSGDASGALAAYATERQTMLRLTGTAIAEHKLGHLTAASAALAALVAKGGDNSLYQQAQVAAQWGDATAAVAALTRARAAGDTGLVQLRSDPLLDPIRRDPRVTAIIAAMHFV